MAPSTMPTLVAATSWRRGEDLRVPAAVRRWSAMASAAQAPVMAAVRVPPSAWITSQSRMTVRSPRAFMSTTERSERPMRRWISWVRPPTLPRSDSRGVRVRVARGSMPYSAVTHPRPVLRSHAGTPCSMVALQRTRVWPMSMRTDPSGMEAYPGVRRTGRIWSNWRPEGRKKAVCVIRPIVRGVERWSLGAQAGVLKRDEMEECRNGKILISD